MLESSWRVDHAAHELHFNGRVFPCDRDIEASACWSGHALLLSSDTDCLSLWDESGLVRTLRVGVYPQDMAVADDHALVCGGCDGHLHIVSLPELQPVASLPLPGMPEKIALVDDRAYVMTLLTEPDVHTALLEVDPVFRQHWEIACFPGIPGALAAGHEGLWVAVSEQLLHFPFGSAAPDIQINGFGLISRISLQPDGLFLWDSLENARYFLRCSGRQCSLMPICT